MFCQETIKPIENALQDHFSDNPNTYYKDTNNKLENLVGTWIYDNGVDYLKLNISKKKNKENIKHNVYSDILTIKYEYRKNGITKYYNIVNLGAPAGANTKPSELRSAFVKGNKISVVYIEPSFTNCHRRHIGSLDLQLVSGTTNQLQWVRTTDQRYFYDAPCDDGTPTDNSDFLIPENMILIKQ